MKRIASYCLVCVFLLLFAACASPEARQEEIGEISMYDLRAAMLAADLALPEMLVASSADKHPEELFKYLSGVDYEKVDGFFLAYAADGMAYEIAVVALKKKSDVSECERSLKKHIEDRVNLYKTYAPAEVTKAARARVATVGRCVALIMCDSQTAVENAMREFLASQTQPKNG